MLDTATVKVRRRWTMRRQRVHFRLLLDELRDHVAAALDLRPDQVVRLEAELLDPRRPGRPGCPVATVLVRAHFKT